MECSGEDVNAVEQGNGLNPDDGGTPAWPLTLLTGGDGSADAERYAQVATATRTGSHETETETETEQWRRAAHAEPPTR